MEILKFKNAKTELNLWSHIKEIHTALRDGANSTDVEYKDMCISIATSNLLYHVNELLEHLDNRNGAIISPERLQLLHKDANK